MIFGRALYNGKASYCVVEEGTARIIAGDPFSQWSPTDVILDVEEARFLTPVSPSKIVAVGLNYRDHAQELGHILPEEPLIFLKPSTSVIGPGEQIVIPPEAGRVDYEAELAVVIGKRAHRIPEQSAPEYILGYTCLNDVTARDLQKKDGQWTRAKSFDTFTPIGPWVVSGIDPSNLRIELKQNGVRRQFSSTNQLIFGVNRLVSHISNVMTLLPGDIIATGTPSGIGPITHGDVVEVTIEQIGTLRNTVA